MNKNNSASTTCLSQILIQKGNKILYLVLKTKPFSEEIIEEVRNIIKERLHKSLLNIVPRIENVQFKDPEQTLKIIILNAIIKILNNMIKEDIIKLNENDLKILYNLLENEEIKLNNDDKNTKTIKDKKSDTPKDQDKGLLDKIVSYFKF